MAAERPERDDEAVARRFARTLCCAVALAAIFAIPAQAASVKRCSTVSATKSFEFYSLTLSVPRCYDGKRVTVTGAPQVSHRIAAAGLPGGWKFKGIAAAPATAYSAFRGNRRGAALVSRSVSFGHCLDLGRLGCTVDLAPVTERIALRLFANGRSARG